MSDAIFVAAPEGLKYDPDDVLEILSQIPGTANLERGEGGEPGARFMEVDYTFGGDTAHSSLLWTCTTLSIHGAFNAALMLALEFNARYIRMRGTSLELHNECYDYQQRLEENMTLGALLDLIENDPYAGAPSAFKDSLKDDSPGTPPDST